jgi:hypothetical protein
MAEGQQSCPFRFEAHERPSAARRNGLCQARSRLRRGSPSTMKTARRSRRWAKYEATKEPLLQTLPDCSIGPITSLPSTCGSGVCAFEVRVAVALVGCVRIVRYSVLLTLARDVLRSHSDGRRGTEIRSEARGSSNSPRNLDCLKSAQGRESLCRRLWPARVSENR